MSEKPEDIGLDNKSQAERDRIDLNHEISGESTGRIQRFLSQNSHDIYGESEKKKSERAYRTMLDMLLAEDAQYAALYCQVTEKLDRAYQAVDQALIDINQRLEASDRKLQILRENATELEDGTKVFQSENGSIYTENGNRVSDQMAKNLEFSENAPSWEEYKEEKQRHDVLLRQQNEINTYQDEVLIPARKRMDDKDNPPSMDELKEIEKTIETQMPDVVKTNYHKGDLRAESPNNLSVAHIQIEEAGVGAPNISAAFDAARLDIPDIGSLPTLEVAPGRTPS